MTKEKPPSIPVNWKTVGRRFSRREVDANDGPFERINEREFFNDEQINRHRHRARETLESEGIDVARLLNDSPNGSAVRDYVLNSLGQERDSRAGLAARIFELSSHLLAYQSLKGGHKLIPGAAHRLGRLVVLERVYELESARQRKVASAKRKAITKSDLTAYCDEFERVHSSARGWKKAACLEFRIDSKTLNERMKD